MNAFEYPPGLRPIALTTVIAALFAATTLAACDRGAQDRTASQQQPPSPMSRAEPKPDMSRSDTTGSAMPKRDTKDATDTVKNAVNDATITASVNAKLASDKELSALRINVDTVDGKVALRGSAPSASARDRATQLASSVDGVRSVENQLVVSKS